MSASWWGRIPRFARWLIAPLLAATLVVFLALRWVIAPAAVEPHDVRDVDAVMMFVGGQGTNRLDAAIDATRASGAEFLVLPNGWDPTWRAARPLCEGNHDLGATVLCPSHERHSTAGEASLLPALQREHEWTRIAVVSSTYHIARVRLEAARCFDGHVTAVDAGAIIGRDELVRKTAREMAAHMHARFLSRGCD